MFPGARVAVFLDGCFWHGCPEHYVEPSTNTAYWRDKIEGNMRRDLETDQRLADEGWMALRFWEHEDPTASADVIEQVVRTRREQTS